LGDIQDIQVVDIDGWKVRIDHDGLVRDLELHHWPLIALILASNIFTKS